MLKRALLAIAMVFGLSMPALAGADQAMPISLTCHVWESVFPHGSQAMKMEMFQRAVHQVLHSGDLELILGIPSGTQQQRQIAALDTVSSLAGLCSLGSPGISVALLLEDSWILDLAKVQGLPMPDLDTVHATTRGWLMGAPMQ